MQNKDTAWVQLEAIRDILFIKQPMLVCICVKLKFGSWDKVCKLLLFVEMPCVGSCSVKADQVICP